MSEALSPLQELPREMLEYLLLLLPIRDLASVEVVSSFFRTSLMEIWKLKGNQLGRKGVRRIEEEIRQLEEKEQKSELCSYLYHHVVEARTKGERLSAEEVYQLHGLPPASVERYYRHLFYKMSSRNDGAGWTPPTQSLHYCVSICSSCWTWRKEHKDPPGLGPQQMWCEECRGVYSGQWKPSVQLQMEQKTSRKQKLEEVMAADVDSKLKLRQIVELLQN